MAKKHQAVAPAVVPCRAMPPGHKWLWRFMRRRDFGRFEACLDAMWGDLAARCGGVMSWAGGEIIEIIRNYHLWGKNLFWKPHGSRLEKDFNDLENPPL